MTQSEARAMGLDAIVCTLNPAQALTLAGRLREMARSMIRAGDWDYANRRHR